MLSSLFRSSGTGGSGRKPEKERSLDNELDKIKDRSKEASRILRQYINLQPLAEWKPWFKQAVCLILRNMRQNSDYMKYPWKETLARFPSSSSTHRPFIDKLSNSSPGSSGEWRRLWNSDGHVRRHSGTVQRYAGS